MKYYHLMLGNNRKSRGFCFKKISETQGFENGTFFKRKRAKASIGIVYAVI